jgi:hypothetical protein
MHFRQTYITTGTDIDGNSIVLHDVLLGAQLTLRELQADERERHRGGDGRCDVSCQRQLPDRLEKAARSDGVLSLRKEPIAQVDRDLESFASRALRLIRWRRGSSGHYNPIHRRLAFEWSFDGESWKGVAQDITVEMVCGIPYSQWSDKLSKSVQKALDDGWREPLAHELLREASLKSEENPRSSVVLAVAAAEIGLKQCVAKLLPEAKWLVEEVQSPPLVKMLKEFLPRLPVRGRLKGRPPSIPPAILEHLQKAVMLRNELVHRGIESLQLKDSTVREILGAVHDLLYLLDLYCGIEWAIHNVRLDTLSAWKP